MGAQNSGVRQSGETARFFFFFFFFNDLQVSYRISEMMGEMWKNHNHRCSQPERV